MRPSLLTTFLRSAFAALLVFAPMLVTAEGWPEKPVRIIAPFAPGGSADTLGRLVAQKLSEDLKQSFIVENRPGAGGVVGSELVAKSPPDGYTLVVSGVASHVISPAMTKVPFEPLRDFTHIALFGGPPIVFVVNPELGASDLKTFVALARANPGTIVYGSPGNGTNGHLVAEMFCRDAGIEITHAPYKGAALAINDLLGSHIAAASTTLATASQHIRAGKIVGLAISSQKRLSDYPDLPTFTELGFPDLVATTWFSLSGPAGMPSDVVTLLNAEVRRILKLPDVREKLRVEGIEPNDLDSRAFTEFVRRELERWTPIVKTSAAEAK
jgi:tripartite-type tricarboxylate transporter receptor subunit TctC